MYLHLNKLLFLLNTYINYKKYGWKVLKLNLDIKYFENCLDLNLCPKFLKFKPPNLQV